MARLEHRAGREGRRVALEGHPAHSLQHPPLFPGGHVSSTLRTHGLHQPLITLGDNNQEGGRPEAGGTPPPIRSQGVEPDSWEEHSHPPPLPGGCLLGQSLLLTCSAAAEPWVRPSVALFFFCSFIYLLAVLGFVASRAFL